MANLISKPGITLNITWITYQDNLLHGHQFKFLVEKHTNHTVRVISFLPLKYPVMEDIIFSDLENMEQEFILPQRIGYIKHVIKNSDMFIFHYQSLPEFYNKDCIRMDGEHAKFGDIYLWIEAMNKPKYSLLSGSNSLFSNREKYGKMYGCMDSKFFTYDYSVWESMSSEMNIEFFIPPIAMDFYTRHILDIPHRFKYNKTSYRVNEIIKDYIETEEKFFIDGKNKCGYGYYGDIFNPGYDIFEDMAYSIIPVVNNPTEIPGEFNFNFLDLNQLDVSTGMLLDIRNKNKLILSDLNKTLYPFLNYITGK